MRVYKESSRLLGHHCLKVNPFGWKELNEKDIIIIVIYLLRLHYKRNILHCFGCFAVLCSLIFVLRRSGKKLLEGGGLLSSVITKGTVKSSLFFCCF